MPYSHESAYIEELEWKRVFPQFVEGNDGDDRQAQVRFNSVIASVLNGITIVELWSDLMCFSCILSHRCPRVRT